MYFGTKVNERESFRLLDLYADRGGNFWTARTNMPPWVPGFAGGESECVVGKWMKRHRREEWILTSKSGSHMETIPKTLSARIIISECEKSLKRLGTDHIDLYFAIARTRLHRSKRAWRPSTN